MLVQRWRILQSALPRGITIKKAIAMVNALAKLHNFCIGKAQEMEAGIAEILQHDNLAIQNAHGGYVTLDVIDNADCPIPTALLGGGEHFSDVPLSQRRPRNPSEHEKSLPRYKLLQHVIDSHMVRPHENVLRNKNNISSD